MKQNILFIIPWLPYPINSGGRQAIFNGIDVVKDQYNVFITYPQKKSEFCKGDVECLLEMLDHKVSILPYFTEETPKVSISFKAKVSGKLCHWANRINPPRPRHTNPYQYWTDELLPRPKAFIEHINHIIEEHHIDIVQSEMLRNLSFVLSLPQTVKKIFVHHELGFVRHDLELKGLTDDTFDGNAIAACAKVMEVGQLNLYDGIITLSAIDSQKLKDAGVTAPIFDSFAIVKPTPVFQPSETIATELSFVGSDGHGPNEIGIRWFLENCWSSLLQQNPVYHLTIVGKWSAMHIQELTAKYPHLTFTGFVDNLENAIHNTIMIVPITVGSGIRMKILEAANLGVPFVSTSIGAEGIPVCTGRDCLIADHPEDFVLAILQMKDSLQLQQFRINARRLIEEHYSLMALRLNRIKIYQSISLVSR